MWVPINKLCGTSSFTSLGDILKTCGFPILGYFFFNFILRQIKVKEEVGVFVEKTFQEFETLCDVVNHGKGEIVQKNTSAMDLYFVFILYHSYFESLSVFLFLFLPGKQILMLDCLQCWKILCRAYMSVTFAKYVE